MYINLLKEPIKSDDPNILTFQFEFKDPSHTKIIDKEYWFEVGDILKYDKPYAAKKEIKSKIKSPSSKQEENIKGFLDTLHSIIHKEKLLNINFVKTQEYDTVVEIFVRTNTGGKKLEYSDILLSKATAKWEHLNAREK